MGNIYRHEIFSGEDYETTLTFRTAEGDSQGDAGQREDITGSTFTCDILNFLGTVVTSFTCTPTNTTGDLLVALPAEESFRLVPSVRYTHKLKRVDPDGLVSFPVYGDIVVR